MRQLFGLFNDEEEAEQAIDELTTANLSGSAIVTKNKRSEDSEPGVIGLPPLYEGSGAGEFIGPTSPLTPPELGNLKVDSDAMQFFQRNLERGGVLVIVEPVDENAFAQAKLILEELGGQVLNEK